MNVLILTSDRERAARLMQFLKVDGHSAFWAPNPRKALSLAKQYPPDCVVCENPDTLQELSSSKAVMTAPALILDPANSWRSIVEAVADVETETKGASPEPTQGDVAETKPDVEGAGAPARTILLLDDKEVRRSRLAAHLAGDAWRVLDTPDTRQATLTILDESIDCFVVSTTLIGRRGHELLRSVTNIRDVHPHPFCIVAFTEVEDGASLSKALQHGADEIIGKASDLALFSWRAHNAVTIHHQRNDIRRLGEELTAIEKRESGSADWSGSSWD